MHCLKQKALVVAFILFAPLGDQPTAYHIKFTGFAADRTRQNPASELSVIKHAPTDTAVTLLRGGPGVFSAPRADGKTHAGVDIVANQSNPDKTAYLVRAVSDGVVAYAQVNGEAKKGYGYTVIIDHQNNYYSLYAHLTIDASSGVARLGNRVRGGQTIGYLADLSEDYKRSSGNVWSKDVLPEEKIQLHFELFKAPKGRSSTGTIETIKTGAPPQDPTVRLKDLGYKSR